jgi:hypothetical protein
MAGDKQRYSAQGNPAERLAHGGKYLTNEEAKQFAQELNVAYDPQMKVVSPGVRAFHAKYNLPGWSQTGSGMSL